jgi:hypothetical protein
MTSLQLGLIIGGVVLVVGVLIYNWVQERRVLRRIDESLHPSASGGERVAGRPEGRQEPTLTGDHDEAPRVSTAARASMPENPARDIPEAAADDEAFAPPLDYEPLPPAAAAPAAADTDAHVPSAEAAPPDSVPASARAEALAPAASSPRTAAPAAERGPQPDPEIESIVTLQPVRPVAAGALAAGLHARVGKPLRWFGRAGPGAPWQLLKSDTPGEWRELAACLLLADRAGAATQPLIDRFIRLVGETAASLPAAFVPPSADAEVARAEALDRICADLDVQIGLTLLKSGPAAISGTRLRGVAEAAGFKLTDSGRFDWIHEDSGAVLYSLQNYRSEPFTADTLRLTSTPGAVFILDVPRVADPVRVFDQMKLAAKRMTQTLDAALVDDNRRPLTDSSFAAIRQQVQTTAAALKEARVEPGSPRALALFGG